MVVQGLSQHLDRAIGMNAPETTVEAPAWVQASVGNGKQVYPIRADLWDKEMSIIGKIFDPLSRRLRS